MYGVWTLFDLDRILTWATCSPAAPGPPAPDTSSPCPSISFPTQHAPMPGTCSHAASYPPSPPRLLSAPVAAPSPPQERPNDDFFAHYGFVPPANPHDEVALFEDLTHALEWHMARYAAGQVREFGCGRGCGCWEAGDPGPPTVPRSTRTCKPGMTWRHCPPRRQLFRSPDGSRGAQ